MINDFGSKLRQVRKKMGKSQEEFGEMLGKSQSAISEMEANNVNIDWEEMKRIASVLEVPLQEFLPEIGTIIQNQQNQGSGVMFVSTLNFNLHVPDDTHRDLTTENTILKEKNALLEEQNRLLHNLLERMNVK